MKKLIGPIVIVALLTGGVWYLTRPSKESLGTQAAAGGPTESVGLVPIADLSAEDAGRTVRVEGVIVKECPHTGCWANVKDDSGEIRIDTQKGGFTLPLKREGSQISVTGTVEVKENGDLQISASSAKL